MDYLGAVKGSTEHLRSDQDLGWRRLREFLLERGIRSEEAALAVIYRDDVALLVAIVVQSEKRMLEVELEYPAGLNEASAMSQSQVVSWRDDVERIRAENRDFVQAALEFLPTEG